MKKSKIIILSAALLVAVMVLSSCSLPIQIPFGAIDMAQLIDETKYVDDNVIYTSVEEIEDLEKATCVSSSGNLALFVTVDKKDNTEYIVYNYATGATTSFTEGEKVSYAIALYGSEDCGYFTVTTTTLPKKDDGEIEVITELYDANCNFVAEEEDAATVTQVTENLICFADVYYNVKDNAVTMAFEKDFFSKTLSDEISFENDTYYYVVEENAVTTYDKSLKFVATYEAPSFAEDVSALVLANGNVFVQYLVKVDPYTDEYDVFMDETKYTVTTVCVDPATGEASDVYLFNYIVGMAEAFDAEDKKESFYADEVNNFVTVYPIENRRVNTATTNVQVGTITDLCTFKAFEVVEGKASLPLYAINANLYAVYTVDGQGFLVDAEGNVKADVTNMGQTNDKYIAKNGKLYDYNLNVVYDYEAEEYTIYAMLDTSVLFENEDGEISLFVDGSFTEIIPAPKKDEVSKYSIAAQNGDVIIVKDASDKDEISYIVYNEKGEEIYTFDNYQSVSILTSAEDYFVITATKFDTKKFEAIVSYYIVK